MSAPPIPRRTELLVVDDDHILAETLQTFLTNEGYIVEIAHTPDDAQAVLIRNPGLAAALVDLVMPVADGLAVMELLHKRNPKLPVVIMTGFGTIETAVEAMKRGAEDYITKPFDREAIRKKIGRFMEVHRLRQRVAVLESDLHRVTNPFASVVYVSDAMGKLLEQARAVAVTDAPVLLLGETGTGKGVLAKAIHNASTRASARFEAVNCGAIPRELVEAELFGVRKGAFTGAHQDKPGIFLAADRGTVFLDEIADMPREIQVKLLRVLQEKEIRPLGADKPVRVDVRVIAATNRPLQHLAGFALREDLYFRLATVVLEIPPLRHRPSDIPALMQHFVDELQRRYDRALVLTRVAIEEAQLYDFPGNVREMQNIIESGIAQSTEDPQLIHADWFSRARIRLARLRGQRTDLIDHVNVDLPPLTMGGGSGYSLKNNERVTILRALEAAKGNRTRAASMLGISRDTLYRKMKDLLIDLRVDIHAEAAEGEES